MMSNTTRYSFVTPSLFTSAIFKHLWRHVEMFRLQEKKQIYIFVSNIDRNRDKPRKDWTAPGSGQLDRWYRYKPLNQQLQSDKPNLALGGKAAAPIGRACSYRHRPGVHTSMRHQCLAQNLHPLIEVLSILQHMATA